MALDKRRVYARRILVAQEAIVLPLRRKVQAELTRVAKAMAAEYEANGAEGLDSFEASHAEELASIFRWMAPIVIKAFIPLGRPAKKGADQFETQLEWDVYYAMLGPLSEDAYQAAAYSLQLAKEVIATGLEEALTQKQIAAKIYQRVGGVPSRSRAVTIARTEVHMAANHSQYQAASETGYALVKEWISTNDGRTRDNHRHLDGKQIALTDKFQVGNDFMRYPGDRSGSAKNIINCRCVVGYVTSGDE